MLKSCENDELLQYEKYNGTWTLLNLRLTHPNKAFVSMLLDSKIFNRFV